MTCLKLKNQTTDATAANSIDISKGDFDNTTPNLFNQTYKTNSIQPIL